MKTDVFTTAVRLDCMDTSSGQSYLQLLQASVKRFCSLPNSCDTAQHTMKHTLLSQLTVTFTVAGQAKFVTAMKKTLLGQLISFKPTLILECMGQASLQPCTNQLWLLSTRRSAKCVMR